MIGQAVQPLRLQPGTEEFAFAGRRRELALGKWCVGQLQCRKALVQQFIEINLVAKSRPAQRLIAVQKAGLGKTHVRCQLAKNLRVGLGLSQRRNRRAVQQCIKVAVGAVRVPVFQLRGGGQQVVGVISRVGLKVFQHHGEKILARKAAYHLA